MVYLPAQAGTYAKMQFWYMYVLRSEKYKWFYVGLTQDVHRRLKQHNSKQVTSTKSKAPLQLIYYEKFKSRIEARDREKFYKVRYNKEQLLNQLNQL